MQVLLDHMADIPCLLVLSDAIKETQERECFSHIELVRQKRDLSRMLVDVRMRLETWKEVWQDSYPGEFAKESHSQLEVADSISAMGSQRTGLPSAFRCQDLETMHVTTPNILIYPDAECAVEICLYYACLLTLNSVALNAATFPEHLEALENGQSGDDYKLACNICCCVEDVLVPDPRASWMLIMLFPLEVAYKTFPRSGIESSWLEMLFKWLSEAKGVKMFETIPEKHREA